MKKRLLAMLLAAALLAMGCLPALAAAPAVKKAEYEGNGVVEVDFTSKKVRYKSAKVVVKDADGKKLTARILEKDGDDITFKVTGLKPASAYTYAISGVRVGSSGKYGTVSGSFRTPSDSPEIEAVKYDARDKEIEVDFATRVQFKGLKVTVKDASGKKLTVRKIEKGTDDVEFKVSGVKKGKSYTVTVSGVRVKGVGKYVSVSRKFVA